MIELISLKTGKRVAIATEQEYLSCPDRFLCAQQMMGRKCVWVHGGIEKEEEREREN